VYTSSLFVPIAKWSQWRSVRVHPSSGSAQFRRVVGRLYSTNGGDAPSGIMIAHACVRAPIAYTRDCKFGGTNNNCGRGRTGDGWDGWTKWRSSRKRIAHTAQSRSFRRCLFSFALPLRRQRSFFKYNDIGTGACYYLYYVIYW